MADKKISQLTNITGADVVDSTDELAIVDASTNETKAITRQELFKSVGGATFDGNVSLGDDNELRFGDSNDLKIEHRDTGSSLIDNSTGTLFIRNLADDRDILIQSDNGSGGATNYFAASGSTGESKMYYYGSPKITAVSNGVHVSGGITTSDEVVAKVVSYAPNQNAPYMIAATTSYTGATTNVGTYGYQHRLKLDSNGTSRITVDGVIGGVETELWALYGGTGNVDIYNDLSVGGNVSLGDNDELRFGDSNDLIIEHDGADSDIRSGTGNVFIRNFAPDQDVRIIADNGSGGTANYFVADGSTGEAQMFYYGSEKLNTTSSGVGISGSATFTSTNPYIKLTDSSTGVDHKIDANSGVGNLVIDTDINGEGSEPKLLLKVSGTTGITVRDTGDVDIAGTLTPNALEVFTDNNTAQGKVKFGRVDGQHIDFHGGSSGNFMTSVSQSNNPKPLRLRVNSGTTNKDFTFNPDGGLTTPAGITTTGNVDVGGALSKSSGSFKIDHPLKPTSHHLVHSFVEAPQADNIYRGKVSLVDGSATVNLDEAGRMTEGTFVALNGNIQCFTTNEDGWTAIRGSVSGNALTIEAQDATCTDTVSWLVIGERHDQHMIDTDWTDAAGRVITEPEKQTEEEE